MEGVGNQLVPVFCVLVLFILNAVRKRSVFCVSSIALFSNFICMLGSIYMYFNPRTGDAYSSFKAMLFLSFCYSLLCLPALFYKDGCRFERNGASPAELVDGKLFLVLARIVALMTLTSFIYFLVDALPYFRTFISGELTRTDFRADVDMSHTANVLTALIALMGIFGHASLFLGVVVFLFYPKERILTAALFLGGMTYAVNMLKYACRAGSAEAILFTGACGLVFWDNVPELIKKRVVRIAAVALAIILIPFFCITVVRFSSPDEADRGVFYSLVSYMSTGPYSFNADYTARTEYNVPALGGMITCSLLPNALDKLTGSSRFERGQELLQDIDEGLDEYVQIAGCYSGEFKSVVGSFLMDYEPWFVVLCFVLISLLFSWLFCRPPSSLARYVCATIYFYSLLIGPIGFGFAARYRNLMLGGLILLCFALWVIRARREAQGREERVNLVEGEK